MMLSVLYRQQGVSTDDKGEPVDLSVESTWRGDMER